MTQTWISPTSITAMNPAKCNEEDYIQWLIASPRFATCTLAAEASPCPVAHDAYNRLLGRLEPSSDALWAEVESLIKLDSGWLIIDDCTIEKIYSKHIDLVTPHWSGNKNAVVNGINLVTLLWTDGDIGIPVDWRVFNKSKDKLTKNDHARHMLEKARDRGFSPLAVLWDSWYSSLENLKLVRDFEWPFFVASKSDRKVSLEAGKQISISDVNFGDSICQRLHLRGFGWVTAYKYKVGSGDDVRYFIGTEKALTIAEVKQRKETANQIEKYHRTLKQDCHIQRCQARSATKQLNHIGLSIRAYVRIAHYSHVNWVSSQFIKFSIWIEAATRYLANPFCRLPATA